MRTWHLEVESVVPPSSPQLLCVTLLQPRFSLWIYIVIKNDHEACSGQFPRLTRKSGHVVSMHKAWVWSLALQTRMMMMHNSQGTNGLNRRVNL